MNQFFAEWMSIFAWAAREERLKAHVPRSEAGRQGIAFVNLGILHYAQGEMREAWSCFVRAAALHPELGSRLDWWSYMVKCSLGLRLMRALRNFRQNLIRGTALKPAG